MEADKQCSVDKGPSLLCLSAEPRYGTEMHERTLDPLSYSVRSAAPLGEFL